MQNSVRDKNGNFPFCGTTDTLTATVIFTCLHLNAAELNTLIANQGKNRLGFTPNNVH